MGCGQVNYQVGMSKPITIEGVVELHIFVTDSTGRRPSLVLVCEVANVQVSVFSLKISTTSTAMVTAHSYSCDSCA